ncbi:family 78 glycoside hydrolase catalytic domain [Paenarthrobacter sp. YAF11_1]|uniref:family 78 glycoside hydrolase catalytic domain n=1 Tax=Paenarthrobacter sp. YAF11_1 TaxID=3233074 RepID=UPI003F985B0D
MTDWTAKFIAADEDSNGAPLLRKEFTIDPDHGPILKASLVLSALGVVEASINGQPVAPDLLTPGWSSFEWRLRYAEYDVTALLGSGSAALGLALGNGWYRGRLGPNGDRAFYGQELAGFAELRVRFDDGHEQVIGTDETWLSSPSEVLANDIYDGQHVDARLRIPGWNEPGLDTAGWSGVRAVSFDFDKLEPYVGPAVRPQQERLPERVWADSKGRILADFGQNLVGWVRVRVTGPEGSTVTLRHAEVLENGDLGTRPLRRAQATDRFTLSGNGDVFEPTLTFHGFRYVEIDGWPGGLEALQPDSLTAVIIHSDMPRTGHFSCSDSHLNQLHRNVVWGVRGNFLDIPTDCPQRDERLGWTGDISVFAPTAAYLFQAKDFLRNWLRDLRLEQEHQDGLVPTVVPDVLKYIPQPPGYPVPDSTAIWSDASVWVPWALWEAYGDSGVLAESFGSMIQHARRVRDKLSPNGTWDSGFQFGDWLDPDAPPNQPWAAKADPGVVATASIYRSAILISRAASILGRPDEEAEFAEMAGRLREAFRANYISGQRITSDCTTAYTLAIVFGLLDPGDLSWAGDRLAELVIQSEYRISTGFAGTPYIMDALSTTGHLDEAYRLLLQQECPSWLYPVTMGATTIWERWDSMLPDGSINSGDMTSFNHYALGAVADWMHRVIGGIAALEPGYTKILIAPRPGGGLSWAESVLETPLGLASVRWDMVDDQLRLDITIPEGATALLRLDGAPDRELPPGRYSITSVGAH